MADVDPASTPGFKGGDKKALREVKKHRNELFELHERLYAERKRSLLVILQGMDTSGKDGTVTHVVRNFNPQGVLITPFKAPTPEERRRGFLWRMRRRLAKSALPMIVTVHEAGMETAAPGVKSQVTWTALDGWREATSLFLLYLNGGRYFVVPKRAFVDLAEIGAFRELVGPNISADNEPFLGLDHRARPPGSPGHEREADQQEACWNQLICRPRKRQKPSQI